MKKLLILAVAALSLAAISCENKEQPQDPETYLELTSKEVVTLEEEGDYVTVTFKTNADWTATVSDPAVVAITEGEDKGSATDQGKIKLSYTSLPAEVPGRYATLTIKAGPKEVTVSFMQGKVFVISKAVDLGVDGGRADFSVITTEEYTMKTYDGEGGAFTWAPVTFDKESGKGYFTVAANEGYDARQAYVKFTVPSIQVPHYEVDEETWEEYQDGTEDAVYRIYVNQEGHSKVAWSKELPADFNIATEPDGASLALFNGKLLMTDGAVLRAYNKETGNVESINVPDGLPIKSICNDDAGNVLFANLAAVGETAEVYAVKANASDLTGFTKVASAANGVYAPAATSVKATGDVFNNAIVTLTIGNAGSGAAYCFGITWTITGGVAGESAYLNGPVITDTVWNSKAACFHPSAAGYLYTAYDGVYSLQLSADGRTNWSDLTGALCNENYGPTSISVTSWDGNIIAAVSAIAFWGPEWWYSSSVYLLDLTNGKLLSAAELMGEGNLMPDGIDPNLMSSDILLSVEGNNLCVYHVDTSWATVRKIVYPKL